MHRAKSLLPTLQTLHLFPDPTKDKERFNNWIYSIGGDIIGLDDQDIYINIAVYAMHTLKKSFVVDLIESAMLQCQH